MITSNLLWVTANNNRVPIHTLTTKHMYNILKLYRTKHIRFTSEVKAIEQIYNYRKKILTINHIANCNTICGKVAVNPYKFPWI